MFSENFPWREKQALRSTVLDLLFRFRLFKLITFISGFVDLQPAFTAEPPNPFSVVEGNNISLEWSYDLGVGGSIRRVDFDETTSSPSVLILEVSSIGQYPVDLTPNDFLDDRYNGRLQANVTATQTSITILGANRTVDNKEYYLAINVFGGSRISSAVTILVQCKYKSRLVFIFSVTVECEKKFSRIA